MQENNNHLAAVTAFQHAAEKIAFYQKFLQENGVEASSIKTYEDFVERVPVIRKEVVFSGENSLVDICALGEVEGFVSAIVSSGTSGHFSYGLLTADDVKQQRVMVDLMMNQFFGASERPPIIINMLPMGVSFASSFPVIPTSVRSDIVLKLIKTFRSQVAQIILITDPHFFKKVIDEGKDQGLDWSDVPISVVIGGAWFPDSLVTYLQTSLQGGQGRYREVNQLFTTMGMTEIGLNLMAGTPDLIDLRHKIQQQPDALRQLFGLAENSACPELCYYMSPFVHIEINSDEPGGRGEIILTQLDTEAKTTLVRYATGDIGQFMTSEQLAPFVPNLPSLPYPIVALWGRREEIELTPLSIPDIKEGLYKDPKLASSITGHFKLVDGKIRVQLRPGLTPFVIDNVLPIELVPYLEFTTNLELSYEHKWKHT